MVILLSTEERSPGQGSLFSGSQVGDDLLSWRECGSTVEIPQQSMESPTHFRNKGKGTTNEETKR